MVVVDIASDPFELFRRTNHVIVGFMLPERFALNAQDFVRLPSTPTFDVLHQFCRAYFRCEQRVHMVGHDYISMSLRRRSEQMILHDGRDP